MKKLALLAGLFIALSGCSKSKLDEAISKSEEFKSRMCECKDTKCADKVKEDSRAYEKSMKDSFTEEEAKKMMEDKGNAEKIEKLEKLDSEMRACRNKLKDDAKPADGAAPAAPATP